MKKIWIWISAAAGITCLVLALGLGLGLSQEGDTTSLCKNTKHTKCFQNGAVATDDERCSIVGANILKKGGSAVDAAIATLLCQGVINNYHSGIGGGAFFVVYDPSHSTKAQYFDCREKAPLAATVDMMGGDPLNAQHGPLAIAIPGELMCMAKVHEEYGILPWVDLFEESIAIARDGFEIYKYLAEAMEEKTAWLEDMADEYGWEAYLDENGKVKKEGDFMKDEKLADTLEKIANDPERYKNFYTGELAAEIIRDLELVGSIITAEDFEKYSINVTEPLKSEFDGKEFYYSRAQSSGPILQLMLNMLEGFDLNPENHMTDLTFHRIIEVMKHGYSIRSGLADPHYYGEEMNDLEWRCSNPDFVDQLRANITEKTHPIDYYHPLFYNISDHGTLHVSTVDKSRQTVAVTSTINLFFGSKIKGKNTGIVFNDEMDDFSSPEFSNDFDVPPSEINFIEPEKRMVSSMAPTIAVDKSTGNPVLSVGGAGGTKITTGILQVILNKLKFGMSNDKAVEFNRVHHQLSPNYIRASDGDETWEKLLSDLHLKRGHEISDDRINGSPVIQSIYIHTDGTIEATSDWRHEGIPDGH